MKSSGPTLLESADIKYSRDGPTEQSRQNLKQVVRFSGLRSHSSGIINYSNIHTENTQAGSEQAGSEGMRSRNASPTNYWQWEPQVGLSRSCL